MIDFPDAPAVDDLIVAANGLTWRWNGTAWDLVSSGEEGGGTAPPVTAARMRASLDTSILLSQTTGYMSDPMPFGKTRATNPAVIDHAAGQVYIKEPGLYLISINITWAGYHATASAPNTGYVSVQAAVVKFADSNSNYWILRADDGMNPPVEPSPVNPRIKTLSASGTYMVDTASEASPFTLHVRLQMGSRVTNERVQISGSAAGPSDGQTAQTYIEVARFGV